MASEFHDLARLTHTILATGPIDVALIPSKMSLPTPRANEVVARALEVGLATREDETLALTERGAALGGSLDRLEAQAQEISHERFRPYTEYLPKEWSTE